MDLFNYLQQLTKELDISVKSLRKTGQEYAKAYSEYRVALAKELLKLKDEGMAATVAYDVARGKPEIARLKFEEISKEAIYKANQESIQTIKLKMRLTESQLQREYGGNISN